MKSEKSLNQWYKRFNQNGLITNGVWFLWDTKKLTRGKNMPTPKQWDYAAISWGLFGLLIAISLVSGCIAGLIK
jgi:hypothetical protein